MTFHTKLCLVQKPLRNNYKVDGFVRDYGGTKYLVLCGHEKNDAFTIEIDILLD